MENEAVDNQAAPESPDVAEIAAIETEQAGKTELTKPVAEVVDKSSQKTPPPTNTAPVAKPSFDAQKSYEELNKNYTETRKWATQMAQERAEYRKQFEALQAQQKAVADMIAKATEVPIDPVQLMKDPKALLEYINKQTQSAREAVSKEYEPKVSQANSAVRGLTLQLEVMQRKMDSKNYPNFAELEPTMMEIVNSGKHSIDMNGDPAGILDSLYKLAKDSNSEQAIKVAEKAAYVKAESQLAKDAKTSVAKGGKGASSTPADLHNMPMEKLEQLVTQLHGVADRE